MKERLVTCNEEDTDGRARVTRDEERCDGRQFHSPGLAAANPLSSKASTLQLTTHVRHIVDRTHSRRS